MSRPQPQDLLVVNARVATPQGIVEQGWVHVQGGFILGLGSGQPPELPNAGKLDAHGGTLLPGFIDVHVHGGGGHDFMDADLEGFAAITKFHAAHGTTGLLATTLTASREHLTGVLETAHAFKLTRCPMRRCSAFISKVPSLYEVERRTESRPYRAASARVAGGLGRPLPGHD